jgi:hypothetical protein
MKKSIFILIFTLIQWSAVRAYSTQFQGIDSSMNKPCFIEINFDNANQIISVFASAHKDDFSYRKANESKCGDAYESDGNLLKFYSLNWETSGFYQELTLELNSSNYPLEYQIIRGPESLSRTIACKSFSISQSLTTVCKNLKLVEK